MLLLLAMISAAAAIEKKNSVSHAVTAKNEALQDLCAADLFITKKKNSKKSQAIWQS